MTKPPFFVEHAIHSENEARNDQSGEYTSTCNEAASIAVLVIATEGALGHRLYTPTYSLYTNMFKRHVLVTFSKMISITDLITVLQLDILILQDSASAVE